MSDDVRASGKKRRAAEAELDSDNEAGDKKSRTLVRGPLATIAKPLAPKKLHKKLYKLVKKAAGGKALKRGVKEVVKAVRKGEKGLCIIAGDISPIDVISHLPVLCEDSALPYIFVESKAELGAAASTKRPTSVVLVSTGGKGGKGGLDEKEKGRLEECLDEVKAAAKEQE